MEDERTTLSLEDAVAMLPDDDYIHTFDNSSGLLIGCDLPRERVIELLREGEPELTGGMALSMGHGLALISETRRLFIATKKQDAVKAT